MRLLGEDSAFPDESCESVLVNGISVLLAILETRKAVNNSYNTNDYLDTCSTGMYLSTIELIESPRGYYLSMIVI